MAMPLPINSPVPIAPPRPIITTWERVSALSRPCSGLVVCVTAASSSKLLAAQDLREQPRAEVASGHYRTNIAEAVAARQRRCHRDRSGAFRDHFVALRQQSD